MTQVTDPTELPFLDGELGEQVELQAPELENLEEEGAQELVWQCARVFIDCVREEMGPEQRLKAIFPDTGTAAMLQNQWGAVPFKIGSLSDRRGISGEEDIVVLVTPGHQELAEAQRVAATLAEMDGPPKALILWNQRLISGDVGIGLNVRRLRERFLASFTTVYHLRPLFVGAVYRRYPGPWKLFLDDKERPGRYLLSHEQGDRPTLEDLDNLIITAESGSSPGGPSPVAKAAGLFSSISRFMKALSQ